MFKEESLWIKKALAKIELDNVHTCLNVGSGSLTFRTARAAEGIDMVWNAENLGELDKEFDLVICTNLLEHVKNPKKVAEG